MDAEALKRINSFLAQHDTSCELLPPSRVQQLLEIDGAIQARLARVCDAKDTIKQQAINVLNISSDTSVSRRTIYNHEILRLYVEYFAGVSMEESAALKEEIKSLTQKNALLAREVAILNARDCEFQLLQTELATTQTELARYMRDNEELNRKLETLLSEQRRSTAKQPCKILIPKDGNLNPATRRK